MTSLKTSFVRNPKAAWQDVDGNILVVTPETKKIHVLEHSGAGIWRFLETRRTADEIVAMLCEEYDVSPGRARNDVVTFCADLLNKRVVLTAVG